ncbi:universal stress protein [Paenibacillus aceris]|uniref:Nucleotide-binding universal stress UspA family protein n=1 Tax=Paenibacillus aceris TaxID=869555 RepID=A0ABS4I3B3_9BACL|nr:universal stress protein [Paenibacillus aceris]MBP1965416.1 nucleotide-binding universal stress UspA family protein [Paenibacillus aceris]NHW33533.1 universal stress protein [Paenibacillus aceris]
MYNHILVPIDGSVQSDQALDHAIMLAKHISPQARVTALHVNQLLTLNEPPISVPLSDILEEEGRKIIEPASAKLSASGLIFDCATWTGDPSTVICHKADADGHDLIVMGSRGAGLMSEILLGSVSHSVVKHVQCPVLIIK